MNATLIAILELKLIRLKKMDIGCFSDPEAMTIHQEYYHKAYWALEKAKKDLLKPSV
jgi:hypothetical protein